MNNVNVLHLMSRLKYRILKAAFTSFQRIGIHILPVHFYSPVPDTRRIPECAWDISAVGLSLVERTDLSFLDKMRGYRNEFEEILEGRVGGFNMRNGSFESVDAETYYGMIRILKPKNIIEIGSGNSTKLATAAVLRNQQEDTGYKCKIICIEPYPSDLLLKKSDIELIQKRLEDLNFELFDRLGKNDILFIDSTHSLKIGNDVYFEYLEIIPRLRKGVYVHIHDIFIPNQYCKRWIYQFKYFWTEQYLLQAFLLFNSEYEVVLPCNFLHTSKPSILREIFPSYPMDDDGPGSFWMRRTLEKKDNIKQKNERCE
jgi:hypothetical protein